MLDLTSTFTASFILISLAIAALTSLVKNGVKEILPKVYESPFWNSASKMSLPIVIGCLLGLILNLPTPFEIEGRGYSVLVGLSGGLLSSYLFAFIKSFLRATKGEE